MNITTCFAQTFLKNFKTRFDGGIDIESTFRATASHLQWPEPLIDFVLREEKILERLRNPSGSFAIPRIAKILANRLRTLNPP